MLKFKYSRRLHILALIILLIISIITIIVFIVSPLNEEFFGGIGLLVAIFVWMALWYLRGLEALAKWFPWFHYISLVLELLIHFFGLVYAIVNSLKLVFALFRHPFSVWEPVNVTVQVLALLVYLLLVYFLAPVPYVLLKGSDDEKDELDREVCSNVQLEVDSSAA